MIFGLLKNVSKCNYFEIFDTRFVDAIFEWTFNIYSSDEFHQSISIERGGMECMGRMHGCDYMYIICRMQSTSICQSNDCVGKYDLKNQCGGADVATHFVQVHLYKKKKTAIIILSVNFHILFPYITLAIIIYSVRVLCNSTVALLIVCPIILSYLCSKWALFDGTNGQMHHENDAGAIWIVGCWHVDMNNDFPFHQQTMYIECKICKF